MAVRTIPNDVEFVQIHKMILEELQLIRQDMKDEIRGLAAKLCNQLEYGKVYNETRREKLNFASDILNSATSMYEQDSETIESNLRKDAKAPSRSDGVSHDLSETMDEFVSQCLVRKNALSENNSDLESDGFTSDDQEICPGEEVVDSDEDQEFYLNSDNSKEQSSKSKHKMVIVVTDGADGENQAQGAFPSSSRLEDLKEAIDTSCNSMADPHSCEFLVPLPDQDRGLSHPYGTRSAALGYKCGQCSKRLFNLDQLRKHKRQEHGLKKSSTSLKYLKTTATGKTVMRSVLSLSVEKSHKCEVCLKHYVSAANLRRHMKIHTGEKSYICDVCSRAFTDQTGLRLHMTIHSNKKDFQCSTCLKQFKIIGNLHRHMKLHTGIKPFVCDVCSKRFVERERLKVHKRVHTGERPYVCQVCSKAFSEHGSLHVHKRTHTGERPYECQHCFRCFVTYGNLHRHLKTHVEVKGLDVAAG